MLKENLKEDLRKAIKEKDQTSCLVLRMALSEVSNKEKEKKYKQGEEELTEEEMLGVLTSEAKKRKEAVLGFEKGGRSDLAKKEKEELKVLERYLPEQISEEEIKKIAKNIIEELNPGGMKDMGKVMAKITPKTKGVADGFLVNKIVKELLSKDEND